MNTIRPDINGNGEVILNVLDIFDNTSDNFKLELIERLSCEDAIIKHVMDQVLSGSTENGYSGSETIDQYRLGSELQQARENLRKKGNRLLLDEVKRLRDVLSNRLKYQDEGWRKYNELYEKYSRLMEYKRDYSND